jgi:intracellular sulfur oxidation DsrE/DsrF family protein
VELGEALMIKFLTELTGAAVLPGKMLLLNFGVKLAVEGSPALPHLRRLAEAGVEIRACGTCLEWFGIAERLAVGKPTNMTGIVAELGAARKVVTL